VVRTLAPHFAGATDLPYHRAPGADRASRGTEPAGEWRRHAGTVLPWFLSFACFAPKDAKQAVEAAIGDRFRGPGRLPRVEVDAVGEDLVVPLTSRPPYRDR
jgi:hypothetical protein